MKIHLASSNAEPWLVSAFRRIEQAMREPFDAPIRLQQTLVANLPSAADWSGGLVLVTDEVGGSVPAFSDGTNWRRVTDRAIVS